MLAVVDIFNCTTRMRYLISSESELDQIFLDIGCLSCAFIGLVDVIDGTIDPNRFN